MIPHLPLNVQIVIVYQPYDRSKYNDRRRFGVGAYSLHKYIGIDNVNSVMRRAKKATGDKVRIKLREHGIIDIYFK